MAINRKGGARKRRRPERAFIHPPARILEAKVRYTIVGGRIVYESE